MFVNRGAYISVREGLTIGDRTQIGEYVWVHDENHAFDANVPILRQGFQEGRVAIGEDVWIGGHVWCCPVSGSATVRWSAQALS